MLGDLENELIDTLKNSELGKRLRMVASLPDVPDKDLVTRWGLDAPAAYVAGQDGSVTDDGRINAPFAIVLVARNARGPAAARQGDQRVIGLYEMVESCLAQLHEAPRPGGAWYATGYQFMQLNELRERGLYVALVSLHTRVAVPAPGTVNLSEFEHLYASWGVVPKDEQDGKPLAEAFISLNPNP